MASENVPSPVQSSRPMKINDPTPAASSPGSSTRPSVGPPSPEASISRNAPSSGEPSSVLTAAKLPAAARTRRACCGASRLARRTATIASPPPRAIRGASGPSTAPRPRVASAAKKMPGSSIGFAGPAPALKPSAGEWPPLPGRYRRASATSTPHNASMGSGHHMGSAVNPNPSGRSVNSHFWSSSTSSRKP